MWKFAFSQRGGAYRISEEPLCQPPMHSSVTLNGDLRVVGPWKGGNMEGTFLASHAHDKTESRVVGKSLHGPGC